MTNEKKPREFWMMRRAVELNSRPNNQGGFIDLCRYYPSEEYDKLLARIEKLREGLVLITKLGRSFDDNGEETMSVQGNLAQELLKQDDEAAE